MLYNTDGTRYSAETIHDELERRFDEAGFKTPIWDNMAGIAGAFVAESFDGNVEAIAEPQPDGFKCWFVSTKTGETLRYQHISAKGFL